MSGSGRRKLSDRKDSNDLLHLIMPLIILISGPEVGASHLITRTVTDAKAFFKSFFFGISWHLLLGSFYFRRPIL